MSDRLFSLLAGIWSGTGRGQFPGVTPFAYRETLTFTRRDEKTLAYQQRAQKLYDGQNEWLESHAESGFIRILESGEMEIDLCANLGRAKMLVR